MPSFGRFRFFFGKLWRLRPSWRCDPLINEWRRELSGLGHVKGRHVRINTRQALAGRLMRCMGLKRRGNFV